jgi:hypothetical protein
MSGLIKELYTSDSEHNGLLFAKVRIIPGCRFTAFLIRELIYQQFPYQTIGFLVRASEHAPSNSIYRTLKTNKATGIESAKALKMLEAQDLI